MKLLLFGDTHGLDTYPELQEKSRHTDLAVCVGDITRGGADIIPIVEKLNQLETEVLIVHGNHERKSTMKKLCEDKENVTFIHKKIEKRKNYSFIGFGGEGFTFRSEEFETFIKNQDLSKHPRKILVTHQPPRYTAIDKVRNRHVGNNSYRKFIDANHPVLSVAGHIHENEGVTDTIRKTTVLNPGPKGYLITL